MLNKESPCLAEELTVLHAGDQPTRRHSARLPASYWTRAGARTESAKANAAAVLAACLPPGGIPSLHLNGDPLHRGGETDWLAHCSH